MLLSSLVAFFLSYLLGSIPFGLLLTQMAGFGDIRAIGSGNIGATNVLRTGNKKLAAATLLLDTLKGTLAVVIAAAIDPSLAQTAGLGAVLGHAFPVWFRFKGGKGVATSLGVVAALSPATAACVLVLWFVTIFSTRLSSLSSLTGAASVPLFLILWNRTEILPLALLLILLIFFKHHANIVRLINRTEPKINLHRHESSPAQSE
ncbi:MAG: glycerol-3-phosphate 1-O-acyltransferase PlsY [Alphaproteobacteria bacterium]|nr:glycerol-3-phosphate 1-O-acyltransferase PlsY [Alphaproteobacteria bacterium]